MEKLDFSHGIPQTSYWIYPGLDNISYKDFYIFLGKICDVIQNEIGISPFEETYWREHYHVLARQILMFMLLRYTKKTQSEIGRIVGGKDHATVIYSKKTINNLYDTDKLFHEQFNRINNKVLNYLKPF
jgi:hypothetical protein